MKEPLRATAGRHLPRVNDRYIPRSALPNVQPGDRPTDDHPLDLARPLEDREDHGLRGSFRSPAACRAPWYQHGFSTGFPRVMTVVVRSRTRCRAWPRRDPADGRAARDPNGTPGRSVVSLRRGDGSQRPVDYSHVGRNVSELKVENDRHVQRRQRVEHCLSAGTGCHPVYRPTRVGSGPGQVPRSDGRALPDGFCSCVCGDCDRAGAAHEGGDGRRDDAALSTRLKISARFEAGRTAPDGDLRSPGRSR